MTPQAKRILASVKNSYPSGHHIQALSFHLDIPEPSIRRCIGEIYRDRSSKYYLEIQNGIVRAYRG